MYILVGTTTDRKYYLFPFDQFGMFIMYSRYVAALDRCIMSIAVFDSSKQD